MWISTFHALCARLLRREAPAIGLTRDFVIYDSSDQLSIVKQALKDLHVDDGFVQPRAALSRISHAKNRMESPEQMAASAGWNRREEQIAKIYGRYVTALREANALDFDDLLLRTVDLFETSPARAHEILRAVPVRDGRRVSGHQPPAVPADSPPGRNAPQPVRGRRSRSVDLQVARRRSPEHPRFRAGLPRGGDRQARTQLPVDANHSRRRIGRHQPEPEPQGQAPVDRPERRSPDRRTSAAATSSRKPTSSPVRRGAAWQTTSTRRSRSSIGRTRSREPSKTR